MMERMSAGPRRQGLLLVRVMIMMVMAMLVAPRLLRTCVVAASSRADPAPQPHRTAAAAAAPWGVLSPTTSHTVCRWDEVLLLLRVRGGFSDPAREYEDENYYDDDDDDAAEGLPPMNDDEEDEEEEDDDEDEEEWFEGVTKEESEWEEAEELAFLPADDEIEISEQPMYDVGDDVDDVDDDDDDQEVEENFSTAPPVVESEESATAVAAAVATTSREATTFTTKVMKEDPAVDEHDSAAYADRMELADAYDEDAVNLDTDGHTTDGGGESGTIATAATAASTPATVPATTPAAAAAAAVTQSSSSSIPVSSSTIDDATRKTLLKELKYRKREVEAMKPEIAAVVAAKKLHRPFEGIPANWYLPTTQPLPSRHPLIRVLPKLVLPAVAVALAVTKGPAVVEAVAAERSKRKTQSRSDRTLEKLLAATVVEEASPLSPSSASSTTDDNSSDSEPLVPLHDAPLVEANEHTTAVDEPHPHSLKPKQARRPVDAELDVTWLDKFITAIERRIKAFLQWEI